MSLFFCPNSPRSLLRTALKKVNVPSKAPKTLIAPSRWLSTCAARQTAGPRRAFLLQSTCRGSAFVSGSPYGSRRTFFSDKTIRKYEDLPREYRDQVGLAFRSLDLTESEVVTIFGPGIGTKAANHLLRILHGRRVAGTLEDPVFAIHTAQFTDDQISRALEYLRKSVPVNEVINAGLRAEDELAQMELDMEAAKTKASAPANDETKPAQEEYTPDPVYGRSKFDEIRSRNVAKRKAQEAAVEEERKAAEARGEVNSGPLANVKEQPRQISNPRIAEYAKEATSDLEAPPEMKAWERILPSATFVVLALGFLATVAMVYEEPSQRFRLLPEISTAQATMGAILAINLLVFLAWRAPPLWKVFNRYMIFVVATVKPITLFTAQFSHQQLSHLLTNMTILWFIGNLVHEEVGRANFLTLYLGCGALGFLGSLVAYTLRNLLVVTSLGASGATLGLCSAYFWEHRNDGFKIFGLPEDGVHGIVFLALIFIPQLVMLGKSQKFRLDVTSHLVGMFAGMLGIEYINRGRDVKNKNVIDVFPGDHMHAASTGEPLRPEGSKK